MDGRRRQPVSYTHLDVYKRQVLGKETIDLYNTSETRSNNNSYGLNYQKTGKELMSQDEIAVMDGAKCISVSYTHLDVYKRQRYGVMRHLIFCGNRVPFSLSGGEKIECV